MNKSVLFCAAIVIASFAFYTLSVVYSINHPAKEIEIKEPATDKELKSVYYEGYYDGWRDSKIFYFEEWSVENESC